MIALLLIISLMHIVDASNVSLKNGEAKSAKLHGIAIPLSKDNDVFYGSKTEENVTVSMLVTPNDKSKILLETAIERTLPKDSESKRS